MSHIFYALGFPSHEVGVFGSCLALWQVNSLSGESILELHFDPLQSINAILATLREQVQHLTGRPLSGTVGGFEARLQRWWLLTARKGLLSRVHLVIGKVPIWLKKQAAVGGKLDTHFIGKMRVVVIMRFIIWYYMRIIIADLHVDMFTAAPGKLSAAPPFSRLRGTNRGVREVLRYSHVQSTCR